MYNSQIIYAATRITIRIIIVPTSIERNYFTSLIVVYNYDMWL